MIPEPYHKFIRKRNSLQTTGVQEAFVNSLIMLACSGLLMQFNIVTGLARKAPRIINDSRLRLSAEPPRSQVTSGHLITRTRPNSFIARHTNDSSFLQRVLFVHIYILDSKASAYYKHALIVLLDIPHLQSSSLERENVHRPNCQSHILS